MDWANTAFAVKTLVHLLVGALAELDGLIQHGFRDFLHLGTDRSIVLRRWF